MEYIIRRIVYAIPIALGVTVICFSLVHMGPVDPLLAVTPDDASPEEIARIRVEYGFDEPVPVQYLKWLVRALGGDFGVSLQSGRPVIDDLVPALSNTMKLALVATVFAFSVALLLGVLAAYHHGRWTDRLFTGVAVVGGEHPELLAQHRVDHHLRGGAERLAGHGHRGPADRGNGAGTWSTCATSSCPRSRYPPFP